MKIDFAQYKASYRTEKIVGELRGETMLSEKYLASIKSQDDTLNNDTPGNGFISFDLYKSRYDAKYENHLMNFPKIELVRNCFRGHLEKPIIYRNLKSVELIFGGSNLTVNYDFPRLESLSIQRVFVVIPDHRDRELKIYWEKIPNLKTLSLSGWNLHLEVVEFKKHCQKLENVCFQEMTFEPRPSTALCDLSGLKKLHLRTYTISSIQKLENVPNLEILCIDMSSCDDDQVDTRPPTFQQFTFNFSTENHMNLKYFELFGVCIHTNNHSEIILNVPRPHLDIRNLPGLTSLCIYDFNHPIVLTDLPSLKRIEANYVTSLDLCLNSDWSSIEVLGGFEDVYLEKGFLKCFERFHSLKSFSYTSDEYQDIDDDQLTTALYNPVITNAPNLISIECEQSHFCFREFSHCEKLESINFVT